MARQIDTSSLRGAKSLRDFDIENALVNQKIGAGNIANAQAGNLHATQMITAAAASGDQNIYSEAKNRLAQSGIDMSGWADDIATGSQQAAAARLAQSPLGSLLNAGLKAEGNVISATGTMGSVDAGSGMTPISRLLMGGGGVIPGLGGISAPLAAGSAAVPRSTPMPLPLDPQQPVVAPDPAADFMGALAQTQAQNGVSQGQDPALAGVVAPAQAAATFKPTAQRPGETQKAYMDRLNYEFEQHKADPKYLKEKNAAEKSGSGLGDNMAETAELVKVVQSNLPQVLRRFQNMRDAAKDASYGVGIDAHGDGFSPDWSKTMFGSQKTADANELLKQATSQQILPELGPALKQAGVTGNKFLEAISDRASGLPLDAKPDTKLKLTDELETTFLNNFKAASQQLRAMGQPAPSPEEIDAMVASLKQSNPAAVSYPVASPPSAAVDKTKTYLSLKNKGYTDEQIGAYFAAKGIK